MYHNLCHINLPPYWTRVIHPRDNVFGRNNLQHRPNMRGHVYVGFIKEIHSLVIVKRETTLTCADTLVYLYQEHHHVDI